MEKTLELAKILRPKAIWGYYGFPYCYNYRTKDEPECPELARRENDKWVVVVVVAVVAEQCPNTNKLLLLSVL